MYTAGSMSANTVPERFSGKAVVISRNYPPLDFLRCAHRGECLSPYLIRWRLSIEEITSNEDMASAVIPRRNGQTLNCSVTSFYKTPANVFREIAEPAPQVQVGRMDKAKICHSSRNS